MSPEEIKLLEAAEELAKVTKQWCNQHKGVGHQSVLSAFTKYQTLMFEAMPKQAI